MNHKHQHIILAAALLLLLTPTVALAWGQSGHNAVTAIAEANLTPKARETIEKYIDGKSIIHYAVWMDWFRHTPEFAHTSPWHTAAVDTNFDYDPEPKRETGDAISATEHSIAALRDYKALPPETVAFHIRILVHAIGDWHCPSHVKYHGIDTKFSMFLGARGVTYHSVWDATVVDEHKWGYLEWAHQLNRLPKDKIAKITAGTPRDWFRQTALDCRLIYDWVKPGQKLEGTGYRDFINKALPLAESQIQKAGYRLAKVLNDLFDE